MEYEYKIEQHTEEDSQIDIVVDLEALDSLVPLTQG